jgi:hypothetical protein
MDRLKARFKSESEAQKDEKTSPPSSGEGAALF